MRRTWTALLLLAFAALAPPAAADNLRPDSVDRYSGAYDIDVDADDWVDLTSASFRNVKSAGQLVGNLIYLEITIQNGDDTNTMFVQMYADGASNGTTVNRIKIYPGGAITIDALEYRTLTIAIRGSGADTEGSIFARFIPR